MSPDPSPWLDLIIVPQSLPSSCVSQILHYYVKHTKATSYIFEVILLECGFQIKCLLLTGTERLTRGIKAVTQFSLNLPNTPEVKQICAYLQECLEQNANMFAAGM